MKFTLFIFLPFVFGYSHKTHSFLGDLTRKYLTKYEPVLLEKIYTNFPNFSFTKGSVWPDKIKNKEEYLWTKKLHYIDINICKKNYSLKEINLYCKNNCIFSALQNFTSTLRKNKNKKEDAFDLLKFVIHFTQDFNQPLHLIGKYRGGNDYKVIVNKNGKNRTTNMHYLWDSQIPEYYIKYYTRKENKKFIIQSNKNVNTINNKIYDNKIYDNYYTNYTDLLINILERNIKFACNKSVFKKYIIFEEYFDKNIIKELFKNYLEMIVFTYKYIYPSRFASSLPSH